MLIAIILYYLFKLLKITNTIFKLYISTVQSIIPYDYFKKLELIFSAAYKTIHFSTLAARGIENTLILFSIFVFLISRSIVLCM